VDILSQVSQIRQQAAVLLRMADNLEQQMQAEFDNEAAYDAAAEWDAERESRERLAVLAANGMSKAPF
jgi:hypothetical protein